MPKVLMIVDIAQTMRPTWNTVNSLTMRGGPRYSVGILLEKHREVDAVHLPERTCIYDAFYMLPKLIDIRVY